MNIAQLKQNDKLTKQAEPDVSEHTALNREDSELHLVEVEFSEETTNSTHRRPLGYIKSNSDDTVG
ncbi:MAG: RNA polymerase sigma factor, RpoD/SigA family, partial [Moorea sp. SIO2B7]|nr:RNA polymerase sigma factor, RpoD/SigA family [Moorena sp. SIO2B7]